MPWSRKRPGSHPRYQTAQHRADVQQARAELTRAGAGLCAEIRCIRPSRLILPTMDLHLCHDRTTGQVLGLGHAACNRSEAARYARARQTASRLRW